MRSLRFAFILALSLILPGCGSAGGALAIQIARKALEAASTMSSEQATQSSDPCRCVSADAGMDARSPSPLADAGVPDGL